MDFNYWATGSIALISVATFSLGFRSSRQANTTQDFLVARRTVRSRRNAAAVSGEYLSAASFLGVAGLILKDGTDALWYPIGFTAGYLALMLFVAAPLRRSGAYTLPDFCEFRLRSAGLRRLAAIFVIFIGMLYMVPQLQGAGLTLQHIIPGVPTQLGAALVAVLVTVNVVSGGMRAITLVQAFQYWVKLFAIAAPAFVLCAVFIGDGGARGLGATGLSEPLPPRFTHGATISVETPVVLSVEAPVRLIAEGTVDGMPAAGETYWSPGTHQVAAGTRLTFEAGDPVPVVRGAVGDNADWLSPASDTDDLLTTYSLIFALFLGTMGLPHVLVRFYTNPDGQAARRTTLHVMLLLGLFYLFPTVMGALSRIYLPELLVTGQTDRAMLQLPMAVVDNVAGEILGAVIAAGAFAAFLSTSSGLLVSVAGVLSTDVFKSRVRDFRLATALAGVLPLVAALLLRPADLSLSVGMSFALAASTFCPVLVLGIWWRKITWVGAAAGMLTGGTLVLTALALTTVSGYTGGWAPWFVQQPGLVTVPLAFLAVIVMSKATQRHIPPETKHIRMRMHAPDRLGLIRDRASGLGGGGAARHALGRHRR
ncbi:cation acetate symporter [Actinokineospora sp. UTMC 2448]|uniref:sodium/solute symporter n=1 Tax=Actinokineospora sp. UTMC 2448 TaxID=2268449 RepID=UPI002164C1BA|nr:cation acetate symporter [Actinokineospora sp. UTMC 2448]UVS76405.1 Acetate transporter ActP [Actinokineospora sp. UTMC 2448]